MNKILVDSGFLAAAYDPTDANHQRAAAFLKSNSRISLIPEVTLSEVAFLLRREGGIAAVAKWARAIAKLQTTFQSLELTDLLRVASIMEIYSQARLDFVDCCIMALSERLNISQVATFDRRDFAIFHPAHCDYLELVP